MKTAKKRIQKDKKLLFNILSSQKKEISPQRIRCSSTFLKRNFFEKLESERDALKLKKSVIDKASLTLTLFQLKKMYNDLKNDNAMMRTAIAHLKENNEYHSNQIQQYACFQDLAFPFEKISLKNASTQKESKEEIETRLLTLINEKNEFDEKYKNEVEYTHTLEYMIAREQQNMDNLTDNMSSTMRKLEGIYFFQKNLVSNALEKEKKKKNLHTVITKLKDDIAVLNELMKSQDNELKKLHLAIYNQEKDNSFKQDRLSMKKKRDLLTLHNIKEQVMKEINEIEEFKEKKIAKEQSIIKLVLGLFLIKKYFLDVENPELNLATLIKSDDYKTFCAQKYHIVDNNDKVLFSSSQRQTPTASSTHIKFQRSGSCFSLTPRLSTFYKNPICTIYLSEIKEKFNAIDFDYAQIYDFHSRLANKLSFTRQTMIKFNAKQVQLEIKKEKFTKRVKEIISKDYKNFNDLMTLNSRFENFMKNYDSFLANAKFQQEKNKDLKLSKKIADKENHLDEVQHEQLSNVEFFRKCQQFISDIKFYFESHVETFKEMIPQCWREEIQDELKQTIHILKKVTLNRIAEFGKKTDEEYFNDFFEYLHKDQKIYNQVEKQSDEGSIRQIADFLENSKNLSKFLAMNIPLEKITFYFFIDITSLNAIELFYKILEMGQITETGSRKYASMKNFFPKGQPEKEDINDKSRDRSFRLSPSPVTVKRSLRRQATMQVVTAEMPKIKLLKFSFKEESAQDSYLSANEASEKKKTYLKGSSSSTNFLKTTQGFGNISERIAEKLYDPYIKTRSYNKSLNQNIGKIKKMTRDNSQKNFILNKKKKEIEGIERDLIIYSNPSKTCYMINYI